MIPKEEKIVQEILQLGLDDWVYLAEVTGIVLSHSETANNADVKRQTLNAIAELLNKKYVNVGNLVKTDGKIEFKPWDLNVHATIRQIEKRWQAYGGPIGRGGSDDVCWISNTKEGDEQASK